MLATWFLGHEAGHAVADVLTGKFNPTGQTAGELAAPRRAGADLLQSAPFRSPLCSGVHYSSSYLDTPPTPQFPFGHGLSYSRFALTDLRCEPTRVKTADTIEVSVTVHNDSLVDGEATLFLFVRDRVASVARPLLELKGVRKLFSRPESAHVTWSLPVEDLAFVGQNLDRVLEPGRFEIHVGQSADPADLLSAAIELAS